MTDLVGQTLGAYHIVSVIGQGGMATVYKAHQAAVDRHVALKVLAGHLQQDPAFAQRFEQEARLIARLEHPHILPIYDFGVTPEASYIAMRYVTGGSLKDRLILQGALPLDQVARLFVPVAEALDYAHSQGVVHRDVKPSNVLLDQRGTPVLSDFGIAKIIAGGSQVTGTAIIGTPAYMSPEQALGTHLDGRSDVYALGVLLYEMVVGRAPYDGDTPMGVILKHVNEPPPEPRAARPELPEDVQAIILTALAKEPGARYATAGAMAQALAGALGTVSTVVTLPPLTAAPVAANRAATDASSPDGVTATVEPAPAARPSLAPAEPIAAGLAAWRRVPGWLVALAVVAPLALAGLWLGGATPPPAAASATPDASPASALVAPFGPGAWSNFTSANDVRTLAAGAGALWSAGPGGLVRWDPATGAATALTAADGLPTNALTDVLVTRDGAVWVATAGWGVARLDPANPGGGRVYTTADGLGSDTITRLYEDAGGTLWAFGTGTRAAASRFTAQGWGQVALPELGIEMRAVRAVYHDPDDTFWLATDGAGLLRVQASAVRPFGKADGLPSDAVYALLPDPAGGLWVGTAQGVARVRGERVEPVTNEALRGLAIQAMLRDREGNLWFGGGAGLVMLESAAGAAQRFGPEDGLPDAPVTSLAEDAEGRLWAGTTEGVARRDGAAWSPFAIPNRPAIHPVRQLAAYGERLVLLAAGDAVYDLDPAALQFTRRSSAGLSEITALAAASDGTLYVGTSAGVVRLDPGATRGIRLIGLPEPSAVTALAVSADGALWAGTAGGLRHYVGSEWRTYQGGGAPPARPISALASAADGAVWAAWSGGIARFDDGDWDVWEIGRELPATVGAVRTLASGDRRLAWAGTQSGELLRYGNGAWTVLPAPPGPAAAVLALAGGPGNVLWVGRADGVARLEAGRWAVVTAGDGLGGARVAALIARPDGSVWFATENGLARWSPES